MLMGSEAETGNPGSHYRGVPSFRLQAQRSNLDEEGRAKKSSPLVDNSSPVKERREISEDGKAQRLPTMRTERTVPTDEGYMASEFPLFPLPNTGLKTPWDGVVEQTTTAQNTDDTVCSRPTASRKVGSADYTTLFSDCETKVSRPLGPWWDAAWMRDLSGVLGGDSRLTCGWANHPGDGPKDVT